MSEIKPSIIEERVFRLLGCVFYGDPFHSAKEWSYDNEIGNLWKRYGKLIYKYSKLINSISIDQNLNYEVHLEPEEYKKNKQYYVLIGTEIKDSEEFPLEMFLKIFPKSKYLKFTTTMENKWKIGGYIYKTWIPENNYDQAFPYVIQAYDLKRYKGLDDPQSEIDWYIPIKTLSGEEGS
jgi:AraC family transcriptional regulator